ERDLWYSSGGSMAFPQERLSFADALTRVVDKGVAMTLKWRSVDDALQRVRHKTLTGLGGSKGILLHGKNGQGFAKGLEVYGEVLTVLGITLTGSDEGIGPESADVLAKFAPHNIVGSSYAHYRGYGPIPHTKDGVQHALSAVHRKLFGEKEMPVLLLGCGGIGSLLHAHLAKNRFTPLSGVIDINPSSLVSLREKHPGLNLFQDRSVRVPSTAEGLSLRWNKIPSVPGLAKIIEKAKGTLLLSPNGGPHPVDFDAASALIASGVRAVVGSANNQAGADVTGSPDPIAWILQAGGVCMAADFVVNRSGAAAVISNGIVLGFAQLQQTEKLVGDAVEEEIEFAFKRGLPPFVYERQRAERAWNQRLDAGEAKAGRFRSAG
ncbi:MAG TPA: hypothetical protein VFX30_01620, partial [bacterium]|nr:hypothetical protein [bacterium]